MIAAGEGGAWLRCFSVVEDVAGSCYRPLTLCDAVAQRDDEL